MRWWPLFLLACSSPNPPASPPAEAPVRTTAPIPTVDAATLSLATAGAEGWGAVFWRDGQASRVGGGSAVLGATGAATVSEGGPGACGGVQITGAPERAAIALPARLTAAAQSPPEAPSNPAYLVERAAWRLDEQLPARDAFSPATSAPDPALQRGVHVASAVKTRRPGAPPVIVASGARECHGVVAVLDADASAALVADRLDDLCEPLALLPAADLDGDGTREIVAWNQDRVVLYRLGDGTRPTLTRIGDWRCSP